jgi:hypothetical protein
MTKILTIISTYIIRFFCSRNTNFCLPVILFFGGNSAFCVSYTFLCYMIIPSTIAASRIVGNEQGLWVVSSCNSERSHLRQARNQQTESACRLLLLISSTLKMEMMFFRNVWMFPNYTTLEPTRSYSSTVNTEGVRSSETSATTLQGTTAQAVVPISHGYEKFTSDLDTLLDLTFIHVEHTTEITLQK